MLHASHFGNLVGRSKKTQHFKSFQLNLNRKKWNSRIAKPWLAREKRNVILRNLLTYPAPTKFPDCRTPLSVSKEKSIAWVGVRAWQTFFTKRQIGSHAKPKHPACQTPLSVLVQQLWMGGKGQGKHFYERAKAQTLAQALRSHRFQWNSCVLGVKDSTNIFTKEQGHKLVHRPFMSTVSVEQLGMKGVTGRAIIFTKRQKHELCRRLFVVICFSGTVRG